MIEVLDKGYVELIDVMGDEKRIANVARISYGKTEGKYDEKLLKLLLRNGHMSPFEQVQFTFKVKCPIFIARQFQRHRTFKFNEQSRRYTKKKWDYYVPDLNRLPNKNTNNLKLQKSIIGMYEFQIREYEELIKFGVLPEVARCIMGTGFYTTFFFTVDLRNLLHFLDLRTAQDAQFEIREYADVLEYLVEEKFPNVIQYWRENK